VHLRPLRIKGIRSMTTILGDRSAARGAEEPAVHVAITAVSS
jgi:hypothetical protein